METGIRTNIVRSGTLSANNIGFVVTVDLLVASSLLLYLLSDELLS